jgi:hypothetical protein
MAGLDPAIPIIGAPRNVIVIAGSSPAMTTVGTETNPPSPSGTEKGAGGAINLCPLAKTGRGKSVRSKLGLVGDVLGGPGKPSGLHGGDAERGRGKCRRFGGLALDGAT